MVDSGLKTVLKHLKLQILATKSFHVFQLIFVAHCRNEQNTPDYINNDVTFEDACDNREGLCEVTITGTNKTLFAPGVCLVDDVFIVASTYFVCFS